MTYAHLFLVSVAGLFVQGCLPSREEPVKPTANEAVVAMDAEIARYFPLQEGRRLRYAVQSSTFGPGAVEEAIVGQAVVGGTKAWRLRGNHRYENGRVFIQEQYYCCGAGGLTVPASLSAAGFYSTYDPPLKILSAPITTGTTWSGESIFTETARNGTTTMPAPLAWSGRVVAFEPVSTPAGRYTSSARVEMVVGPRYVITEWLVADVGVVKREIHNGSQLVVRQELLP